MNVQLIMSYVSKIGLFLTAIVASFLVFKGVLKLLHQGEAVGKKVASRFDKQLFKQGKMPKQQLFLSKMGISYRFGNYDLKPSNYIIVRIFVGVIVAAILLLLTNQFLPMCIGFPIGYFGINALFQLLNKRDNADMSLDVYNTYANLKIQLSSDVYINECLEYTYKITKNERYRTALKELLLNFSDKTITSSEAINIFRNRFSSKSIDQLCSMITSFVEYGLSDAYLDGIMFEATQLLEADATKTQQDIETKTGLITFAFFVLVIAMVGINMLSSINLGNNMF